jgi:hypothetical protein
MNRSDETDVGGLAAVLNARLVSESRIAKAIGFGWLCAGAASASILCGLGIGAALYGYSFVLSVKPAGERTARALTEAFQRAKVHVNVVGSMALANSEVKLAPGQTVQLADGAIVTLDPDSVIRVVGNLKVDIPQPSKDQLQLDVTASGQELPFTEYVVFKSVNFASGEVVTGWGFDLADPVRPKAQFCYYAQKLAKGVSAKQMLAFDASPRRPSASTKLNFDFDGALSNCIWFSGL